jgi:hypothetical protein
MTARRGNRRTGSAPEQTGTGAIAQVQEVGTVMRIEFSHGAMAALEQQAGAAMRGALMSANPRRQDAR